MPDNSLQSLRSVPLARHLLATTWMAVIATGWLALTLATSGCILPPPLTVEEEDAGISNSPPEILSAGPAPDFSFPGVMVLDRPADETRTLTLTVSDGDVGDTLYARFFVDYTLDGAGPLPHVVSCIMSPGDETRVGTCEVQPICSQIDTEDTGRHLLEVMVADRAFLTQGQPLFRALPEGARYSIRSWLFSCNPPAM